MYVDLYVEPSLCQTCDSCAARKSCKVRAIVQFERGDLPAVDMARCRGCLVCRSACPHGALVVRRPAPRPRISESLNETDSL